MSKISDLVFRYLHRKLATSKGTPTQYTASAGTVRGAVCAALTEADDYWNGAIVRWDSGPNAGLYCSVADFVAASHTLTFGEDLPYAVASGHTFTLLHGGKYASAVRIPGLKTAAPVNVTGFSITHAAMLNGVGTGVLKFKYNGGSGQALSWTPPGESEGTAVDVSALGQGAVVALYGGGTTAEQRSKYLVLTRTSAAMPTANRQDDISLESSDGSFLATFASGEAEEGVTIYRPVAIENTAADTIYAVKAYCATPWANAGPTAIATGGGIGTGADELTAADLTGWGSHGFVYNATKADLRYYYDRSGNTVKILSPVGGIRGFTAIAWQDGDVIEPYPWFDIGLDAPGTGSIFEDPASKSTAPAGVTFSCPRQAEDALLIGDLAAGGLYVIWERFFIPAGFMPLEAGRADLRLVADVTE